MTDEIKLRCRCGAEGEFERSADPSLPVVVALIVSDKCPTCDDGDRGSERYFNADGKELDFETWQPLEAA
ncbi:MAG: hypothetical protein RL291_69 [Pseudomonadota bacterium]|jgi:hypothetical protein